MRRAAVGSVPFSPSKTTSTTSSRRRRLASRAASRGGSRVEPLELRTLLSSGDLDPTFGNGGTVTSDVPGSAGNRVARQVALQSDGKLLQAAWHGGFGASEMVLAVTRFDRFGFLDTSFGDNGLQIVDFPGRGEIFPSIAVGPNDEIVVSTWTTNPTTDPLAVDSDVLVARLNPDGAFDTSFGGDGYVAFDFGQAAGGPSAAKTPDLVFDVAVQGDGRIVTAGSVGFDNVGRFALARLNPDGSLDTTFGGDGLVTAPFAGYTASANAIDVDAQGRLIVLGQAATRSGNPPVTGGQDWAVARYNPDGSFDTSFDNDGWTVTTLSPVTDTPFNIKAAPGGKIVAAGSTGGPNTHSDMAIVRYNADGSPDASFGGGDGIVTFGDTAVNTQGQTVQAFDEAEGLAVLGDGSVLVSGRSGVGLGQTNGRVQLLKFTPAGNPDANFGAAGKVVVPDLDEGSGLTVQPDGYVVVGGYLADDTSGFEDFALARFDPSGTTDWSFGPRGTGVTAADFQANGFTSVTDGALQPDGKVVVGGFTIVKNGNLRDIALARYNADGTLDDTFGTGGIVQIDLGGDLREVLNALTLDAEGRIVITGSITDATTNTSDFLVGRLMPDGTPDFSFAGTGFLQVRDFAGASNGNEEGNDVLVQPDGHIVVVGEHRTTSTNIRFAAVRLGPDGSYDTSFGQFGTGDFHTQFTNVTDSFANTVTLAPDQGGTGFDLVLAGRARVSSSDHFALLRLNSDGSFDNGFGAAGKVTAPVPSASTAVANDVVVDPLGRILVGGTGRVSSAGDEFAIMRFTSGGALDTTFDTDGKVVTGFDPGANDLLNSLALLPDGSILAGGTASNNFALVRYTDAGSLDTSFGTAGRVIHDFEPGFFPGAPVVSRDSGVKVFAYPGDRALMVGSALLPRTGSDFAAARFVLSGPPNAAPVGDPGGPYTVGEGSGLTLSAGASADTDGTIIKYEWDLSYDNFSGFLVDGVGEQVAFPAQADEGSPNTRRVALRVTDDNFATHTTIFTITVNNVAPTVAPIADATVAPGTAFTAGGSFTDPGTSDTFTATVNYGDGPNQTLTLNPDKTFALNHAYATPGTYTVTVTVRDNDGGQGTETFVVTVRGDENHVEGRQVFYHRSAFDTAGGPAAAVPPQKQPLLPGAAATGVNITNYTRGINGLIVTLDGAAGGDISAADFRFRVGASGDPETWADAPQPQSVTAAALPGGKTQVVITWADGAIRNTWLQATVLANADTKLAAPDVFYYGNLVGNAASPPGVIDAADYLRTRAAISRAAVPPSSNNDHDHDGRVGAFDLAAVRANLGRGIAMLTAPAAAAAPVAAAAGPAAAPSSAAPPARAARPPERPARRSVLDETSGDLLGRDRTA